MYATTSPRSILKHQSPCRPGGGPTPCVRFPSSPQMSTVFYTHCSSSYDRRPIGVLPNTCAMPDRHCRDYEDPTSPTPTLPQGWGNHVHPSVFGRMCQTVMGGSSSDEDSAGSDRRHYSEDADSMPQLTHDDASSEESDGVASPPPEACNPSASYRQQYASPSQSHVHTDPNSHPPLPGFNHQIGDSQSTEYSMSFLPHVPDSSYKPKKRSEKTRPSLEALAAKHSITQRSFSSSWAETDASSCLGGF